MKATWRVRAGLSLPLFSRGVAATYRLYLFFFPL